MPPLTRTHSNGRALLSCERPSSPVKKPKKRKVTLPYPQEETPEFVAPNHAPASSPKKTRGVSNDNSIGAGQLACLAVLVFFVSVCGVAAFAMVQYTATFVNSYVFVPTSVPVPPPPPVARVEAFATWLSGVVGWAAP